MNDELPQPVLRGGFQARGEVAATAAAAPVPRPQRLRTTPTYDPTLPPGGQFTTHGQMVLNLQAAIDALMSGNLQSYSLPTGVSVTKKDLPRLHDLLQAEKRMAYADFYGKTSVANLGTAFI